MIVLLARVVRTSVACPSQWDAWTVDGQYLYLRYRYGIGTVEEQPGPDYTTWTDTQPLVAFGENSMRGDITLEEFMACSGLALAPDADVYPGHSGRPVCREFLADWARYLKTAAHLAWPGTPLVDGEETTVGFIGTIGDPEFCMEVHVHRDGHLVRHATFPGLGRSGANAPLVRPNQGLTAGHKHSWE